MGIFQDPLLPELEIPKDLKTNWYQIGSLKYKLLPAQWRFLAAKEETVCYMGGYGSGKTRTGALKVMHLAMHPENRIIVGRNAATDLEETSQRDLVELLYEAELLKTAPNQKTKKAIVHCVDPVTQQSLGYTSEISFQHMDDPTHLRGRHIGAFWIDEASEVHKDAGKNLMGRLRLPSFAGRYQGLYTGNPQGRNYLFDQFFNEEELKKLVCGHPECKLLPEQCNARLRRKRRGIHARSSENYFISPDYLQNMMDNFSENEKRRFLDAEFDVVEGAVFGEFDQNIHVLQL